ncbi:gas vesicle protein GvpK [Nocardia tengchongensis]|uniref:gas vesicle protein GvpK n=1 Tax=Nocardia tengchongensis TaxID=2055889 RepID=UPI00365A798F
MHSAESRLAASALLAVQLLRRTIERERIRSPQESIAVGESEQNRERPALIHLDDAMNDLCVHFDLNPNDIDLDFHAGMLSHPPGEPPEPVHPWPPLEPVPVPSPPPVPEPPDPLSGATVAG